MAVCRIPIALALLLSVAGCGDKGAEANKGLDSATPRTVFKRVYDYPGNSRRPDYGPDRTRKVQFIDVGTKKSSAIGESLKGSSWRLDAYEPVLIGFADGSEQRCSRLTLVYDNYSGQLAAIEIH